MKYSKELDSEHPMYERTFCLISYRKWKRIKPGRFWKFRLITELALYPRTYMETNLKTAYKICKRYEKRYGVDGRDFYTMVSKIFSDDARQIFLSFK